MAHGNGYMLFSKEPSPEKQKNMPSLAPWKVLIIDDDASVHQVSALVLKHFTYNKRSLKLLNAYSAAQAIQILGKHQDIAVAIVDVVMETEHAGLDLIKHVRESMGNFETQLVIRTGQPGYAPELQVVLDYEVNAYCEKSELTQTRFLTSVVSALRNYERIHYADKLLNQTLVAESINETRALFFAQISHEIRTPISGVIGLCDLLQSTSLTSEQAKHVRSISDCGQLLLTIVNDILDISKIEAGKLSLNTGIFNLHDLIASVVRLLQPLCSRGVTLAYDVDDSVPVHLKGDSVRIGQILNNLIGNAIKFTPQGRIRVNVRSDTLEDTRWRLEIEVRDTGIGIPEDKLNQLFNAYQQVDGKGHQGVQGTGLGLTICKQLTDLMEGDIQVESQVNKGSVFTVHLVLEPVMEDVVAVEEELPPLEVKSSTILVVDDNPTNLLVARKRLEKLGFKVMTGRNGKDAIQQMQKRTPDLVLMDCQMPEMDGFEATKTIRGIKAFRNIPVIALSAGSEAHERPKCFASGMNDFLHKPLEEDKLRGMLSKWLGYRSFM